MRTSNLFVLSDATSTANTASTGRSSSPHECSRETVNTETPYKSVTDDAEFVVHLQEDVSRRDAARLQRPIDLRIQRSSETSISTMGNWARPVATGGLLPQDNCSPSDPRDQKYKDLTTNWYVLEERVYPVFEWDECEADLRLSTGFIDSLTILLEAYQQDQISRDQNSGVKEAMPESDASESRFHTFSDHAAYSPIDVATFEDQLRGDRDETSSSTIKSSSSAIVRKLENEAERDWHHRPQHEESTTLSKVATPTSYPTSNPMSRSSNSSPKAAGAMTSHLVQHNDTDQDPATDVAAPSVLPMQTGPVQTAEQLRWIDASWKALGLAWEELRRERAALKRMRQEIERNQASLKREGEAAEDCTDRESKRAKRN